MKWYWQKWYPLNSLWCGVQIWALCFHINTYCQNQWPSMYMYINYIYVYLYECNMRGHPSPFISVSGHSQKTFVSIIEYFCINKLIASLPERLYVSSYSRILVRYRQREFMNKRGMVKSWIIRNGRRKIALCVRYVLWRWILLLLFTSCKYLHKMVFMVLSHYGRSITVFKSTTHLSPASVGAIHYSWLDEKICDNRIIWKLMNFIKLNDCCCCLGRKVIVVLDCDCELIRIWTFS